MDVQGREFYAERKARKKTLSRQCAYNVGSQSMGPLRMEQSRRGEIIPLGKGRRPWKPP